jgi:hypothetical protein
MDAAPSQTLSPCRTLPSPHSSARPDSMPKGRVMFIYQSGQGGGLRHSDVLVGACRLQPTPWLDLGQPLIHRQIRPL